MRSVPDIRECAALKAPGVSVSGFGSALIAAVAIGFINGTLGTVIKFFAWPLRVLTLGLVSLIINGLMLMLAAALVPGFRVDGFFAAVLGSILLSVVTAIFGWFLPSEGAEDKRR